MDPNAAAAHVELGQILLLTGETEEAIAAFRQAAALAPGSVSAHMGLSAALAEAERIVEARQATEAVWRLDRTFDRPCLGEEPIGRVVILKAAGDACFRLNRRGDLRVQLEINNADEHFDRTRLSLCDFFVDGIEPGQELEALPDCDLIFNAMSDADLMPSSRDAAKRIADAASVPVINHPDAIQATQRHRMHKLIDGIDGIVSPKIVHLDRPPQSQGAVERTIDEAGMVFPVLARCAGTHNARSLERIENIDALWTYLSAQDAGSFYISEFVDFVSQSGMYIKARFFVVDGQMFPGHMLIWDHWRVHGPTQVQELMWANDWMIDETKSFFANPEAYVGQARLDALRTACARVPLEYFGIDFACLAEDRVVVFEANPAMSVPAIPDKTFPFREPHTKAIIEALQRLLEKKIPKAKSNATPP